MRDNTFLYSSSFQTHTHTHPSHFHFDTCVYCVRLLRSFCCFSLPSLILASPWLSTMPKYFYTMPSRAVPCQVKASTINILTLQLHDSERFDDGEKLFVFVVHKRIIALEKSRPNKWHNFRTNFVCLPVFNGVEAIHEIWQNWRPFELMRGR